MIPHVQLPGHAAEWTSKDRAAVTADLGAHFRRTGFVLVDGPGIPADLIEDVYAEMRRFYQLSQAEKSLYDATERSQFLGYRGLGRERSRTHGGTEACEQYRIGHTTQELPLSSAVDFYQAPFPESLGLSNERCNSGC
ncbi:2-oxoglutarate and iron-dependent oxygenase domain-containing protein [Streptomyces sp. NPDC086010]|uniref:2-oxoglutarate and iron-dependent oxygenase domain-containing protein n=1 Tax=Streptomyces sp. NPDC086010 TaxID=3365745 RepID=UPI0037D74889